MLDQEAFENERLDAAPQGCGKAPDEGALNRTEVAARCQEPSFRLLIHD
jgi:hypothetical protein